MPGNCWGRLQEKPWDFSHCNKDSSEKTFPFSLYCVIQRQNHLSFLMEEVKLQQSVWGLPRGSGLEAAARHACSRSPAPPAVVVPGTQHCCSPSMAHNPLLYRAWWHGVHYKPSLVVKEIKHDVHMACFLYKLFLFSSEIPEICFIEEKNITTELCLEVIKQGSSISDGIMACLWVPFLFIPFA